MNQTLEQKRAQYGLRFIKNMTEDVSATDTMPEIDKKFRDKLNTLIQKAPVQILQNGLGQMLAFLLADNEGKQGKKRKASGVLYEHLEKWLCGATDQARPCRVYDTNGLIEQLAGGNRRQYIRAQKEALTLFAWLKKFAAAWLSEGGQ